MFINLCTRLTFMRLKFPGIILLFFCLYLNSGRAQQLILGTIVENDSVTGIPFAYIINKSNGNGTMSDNEGHFTLATHPDDTLICSYLGYIKRTVPVRDLLNNATGEVKLVMNQMVINLNVVTINTFKFKPYEREYMSSIIDKSQIKKLDNASSPISSLYMRYSKEGKQIQKLAKIFEDILIEEEVQRRLSREILVRLTGDETIDYYAFRKYCYYVNDYYIVTHEGAELYTKVMECYKRWKEDGSGYKKREDTKDPPVRAIDGNWKKREDTPAQD